MRLFKIDLIKRIQPIWTMVNMNHLTSVFCQFHLDRAELMPQWILNPFDFFCIQMIYYNSVHFNPVPIHVPIPDTLHITHHNHPVGLLQVNLPMLSMPMIFYIELVLFFALVLVLHSHCLHTWSKWVCIKGNNVNLYPLCVFLHLAHSISSCTPCMLLGGLSGSQ